MAAPPPAGARLRRQLAAAAALARVVLAAGVRVPGRAVPHLRGRGIRRVGLEFWGLAQQFDSESL
jgi:hypothetical protein